MCEIKDRMKKLRTDREYTQKAVAEKIHVGQRTYSDYERGKIRIPAEYLIILAREYKVDMNYMLGVSDIVRPFPEK